MSGETQQRVNGPAIGLIVTGALNVLVMLASLAQLVIADPDQKLEELRKQFNAEFSRNFYYTSNGVLIVLWLGMGAFLIFAGLRMRQLKDWVLCVVACFASFVPCVTCCCPVAIPIGIWGLVVLMKDDVKQAFTS